MSESIALAVIAAGQPIILALIGLLGARLGKMRSEVGKVQAAATRTLHQVENDHTTNLRDENDSRHAETKRWIDELRASITRQFSTVGKDIGGIREELRDDRKAQRALAERVTHLENKEQ